MLVLRRGESWDGWLAVVWEGRGEMGKKKGKKKEKQRKRVSAEWVYNAFYRWNHWRNVSVGIPVDDSACESATSLYDYPGLNPSVIPSVKSSEKNPRHHMVTTFQKNCIGRRYIPTEFETELCPSVIFTDEKIPSVISLVFVDFLVVSYHEIQPPLTNKL